MAKRCIVFFDGQNLYRRAKEVFGPLDSKIDDPNYNWPSYDVETLADALVARERDRRLVQVRFYTGVPTPAQNAHWSSFWANKLRQLERSNIYVYRGRINNSNNEKGVDVSIAVDIVRLTYEKKYDLAIIISEDTDLCPAIDTAKEIARDAGISVHFESVFPYDEARFKALRRRAHGIPGTEPIRLSRDTYDACRDPRDYRVAAK